MTYAELKIIIGFARNYFLKKYPGKDLYVSEIQSHVALKYERYYDESKGNWQNFVMTLTDQAWSKIYKKIINKDKEYEIFDMLLTDFEENEDGYDETKDAYLIAFYKLQIALDKTHKTPISKKYFEKVTSFSMTAENIKGMTDSELLNNIDYYKFTTWLDKDKTRYFQELALLQMIMQVNRMDELYDAYCKETLNKGMKPRKKEEFPFVGAVLVSADGTVIANSYKGCESKNYQGSITEHCEYLMFKKVLTSENLNEAKGGTLFVTLEPCTSRIFGKVPCAIHCLESGIKNIYIGTFDPNESVSWEGIDILRTGCYVFKKSKSFYSDEHGMELQRYFRENGYREEETFDTLTFFISDPLNIFPFYPDLTTEIIKYNQIHNPDLYSYIK